jgi:hypothetical protein
MWDTDRPACGTNDEWWTSRHDEWNTGAYGTDSRPPGTPEDPHFNLVGPHVVTLAWTAPGDDWLCGQAASYRIIGSNDPIEHPGDGTVIGDFAATASAGQTQSKLVSNPNTQYRNFAVMYKDNAGNWGHLTSVSLGYVRPAGATPVRASLVPAFQPCTAPNRAHGSPLDDPSCDPPVQESSTLTVGEPTVNGASANSVGSVRLSALAGNPATEDDEADVGIAIDIKDVRCAGTSAGCSAGPGSDYAGRLLATSMLRITDRYNGSSGKEEGTVVDTPLEVPFLCTTTAGVHIGARCTVNTTMDSLLPGAVVEGKRAVWQTGAIEVSDAGPNGNGYGSGCPPACGDGDEAVFMRQGVFVP